ncbi:fimbrial protein [Yersinia mollaretii]|uniref:fimbrial protein n=1 Tax=Yersinia mollaretii TaxID=33060 RepID=UPI0005E2AF96|nr:fimbrial protein [Yersinia mollaretii]MDN0111778.1 fimbrial protein [Yersinia mollaretii]PJE88079.1 type 1 fimbrial protein [Yersinia mollaretii]CQD32378.1 putative mannose-resistant/Proteus-like fimbrial protein [Yersinia mollaretii]CQH03688.1 putative mannose-resistant/Proteus-like fimbrial protein [Yersinia mollaretii]
MKMNKIVLGLSLAFGIAAFANAADQGHGTVTFTGSIIDAPCSISSETANQEVDLGSVSNVVLKNGGKSVPQPFDIKLEQCDPTTLKTVTTTFTGDKSLVNPDLLGITGTAEGASVAITDLASNVIKLGKPTTAKDLSDGDTTLRFSAYLQGDGASATIKPGNFSAVAEFKLDYK